MLTHFFVFSSFLPFHGHDKFDFGLNHMKYVVQLFSVIRAVWRRLSTDDGLITNTEILCPYHHNGGKWTA